VPATREATKYPKIMARTIDHEQVESLEWSSNCKDSHVDVGHFDSRSKAQDMPRFAFNSKAR